MKLHELKNASGARRRRLRVGPGRASGKGKTCGRGHKGQMSRKGSGHKPGFGGGQMPLVRRIPKGGFKNPARRVLLPVNVAALSVFEDGTEVTPALLRARGLARGQANRVAKTAVIPRAGVDRPAHTLDDRPDRIVSLSATHTEILYAIDAGELIVATDLTSNYPPPAEATVKLDAFNFNTFTIYRSDQDQSVQAFLAIGQVDRGAQFDNTFHQRCRSGNRSKWGVNKWLSCCVA